METEHSNRLVAGNDALYTVREVIGTALAALQSSNGSRLDALIMRLHRDSQVKLPILALLNHANLGDDPVNQLCRRHVERRVPHRNAVRRDAHGLDLRKVQINAVVPGTLDESHLLSGTLLDHDVGSGGGGEVDGGARRRYEELDAVVLRGDGQLVGADLVGRVTVCCHAVRAYDDGGDVLGGSSQTEESGSHGVRDQRRRDLVVHQLERGQARALVVRPGLGAEGVLQRAVGVKRSDHTEGCTVTGGGERAGWMNSVHSPYRILR
jgi:hypothetical protein